MKVLLCAPHFAPFFEGGTEAVVRALSVSLRKQGHEVKILAGHDDVLSREDWPGDLYRKGVDVDGYPVHFVPRLATPEGDLEAAVDDMLLIRRPLALELVIQFAEEFQPDVVHVHHHAFLAVGIVAGLVKEGFPVALSLHDLFMTCPRFFRVPEVDMDCPPIEQVQRCAPCLAKDSGGVSPAALEVGLQTRRELFAIELGAATVLLAPSAHHGQSLEQIWGLKKGTIRTFPNGLVRELGASAHGGLRTADEPLHIFHHGHRSPVKGTLDLVQAMAMAAEQTGVKLILTLAGGEVAPGFDDELRAAAQAVELRFPGSFTSTELPSLAKGAHIAAYPSRAPESYGLVVDEALAMGLPALVADAGALSERIRPNGPDAPPAGDVLASCDPAAWAARIANLVRDPGLLTRWRAAIPGRMRGPSEAGADLVELYNELILHFKRSS